MQVAISASATDLSSGGKQGRDHVMAFDLSTVDWRAIREKFGISLHDLKSAADLAASDPLYEGDLMLAAAAVDAAALAIHVGGGVEGRRLWNHRRALLTVDRLRAMMAEPPPPSP
jgi:hypothetical protein